MRWRDRSSFAARRCSGCATGLGSSRTPPRPAARRPIRLHAIVYLVRPSSARRAPLEIRACAARCSADTQHRPRRARALPRSRASATDVDLCDARRLAGAKRPTLCCASMRHDRVRLTMQRLADLLDAPVDRPMIQETTALGAAYLAGLPPASIPSLRSLPITGAGTPLQAGDERGNARAQACGWRGR